MQNTAKYNLYILFSSIIVILIGGYVLLYNLLSNYIAGIPELPGNSPMAVDSAVCFLLAAASLIFCVYKVSKVLAKAFGLTIILISLIAFLYYFYDVFEGIHFGMSPQTMFCFLCLGAALLFLKTGQKKIIIQSLLNLVTILSFIALVGHLFTVPELYRMTFATSMSFYSAFAFFVLSAGASLVNPTVGVTGMFTGKMIGNIMARKIFLQMLFVVLASGYLHILDHRYNWFSEGLGSALQTVLVIIVGLFVVWQTSEELNKAAEQSQVAQENFRLAVESAPYALVISDRQGVIKLINHHTEKMYGYNREELIGKEVKLLIPSQIHGNYEFRREQFFLNGQVVKLGGINDGVMLALRKDGTQFPIEIILTPIKTDKGLISLASIVDISERKAYEKIIRDQVAELQAKNQELEQFNYIASHDLQEPLRTVANYIQLLEEDYPEQVNDEIRQHLAVMNQAINRMQMLVRSLLEFGKLGKHRKLAYSDCNRIVNDTLTDLNTLIKSTSATITIDNELPVLYAYETELRQLFQNLINNAIKFRKKDVTPQVEIGSQRFDGYYEFYVKDNGIGINPQHTDRIFNIFQRLHKQEAIEGHGIGLANCRKIADMHGGKIWVESIPGEGSTFKFTLMNFRP